MAKGGLTMLQIGKELKLDKMGVTFDKEQAIIYRSWLMQLNHRIVLMQGRIVKKKAFASNNGSGNEEDEVGCSWSVEEMI